jgi:hypothetical protein
VLLYFGFYIYKRDKPIDRFPLEMYGTETETATQNIIVTLVVYSAARGTVNTQTVFLTFL